MTQKRQREESTPMTGKNDGSSNPAPPSASQYGAWMLVKQPFRRWMGSADNQGVRANNSQGGDRGKSADLNKRDSHDLKKHNYSEKEGSSKMKKEEKGQPKLFGAIAGNTARWERGKFSRGYRMNPFEGKETAINGHHNSSFEWKRKIQRGQTIWQGC